ncbi:DMT family transporter [Candidatus Kinetoplastidibacterium crithidiae]|uniref:SMR family small multidrug resistance protein n=1 Tax=Candidatus Kinetoplastidibacterium crithidiae TCC036E TaxID=1208918 RepID=M1LQC9_9PROT|nr:SMR family transporter [Candidatus Kinetoplastibacterium crithidii]AGF47802.1 SMR family small multidrug resistance protein [Candidatus Kinetoplastibacterium crithidii TCC036E]
MKFIYLSIAIITELMATIALKNSIGFTKLWPSLFTCTFYFISTYFLSLTLEEIPVGVAYAIWCGVGIVLVSIIGAFFFKQKLDTPAIIGISMIVLGVVIMNLFSKVSV